MNAQAPRSDRFLEWCALAIVALTPTQVGVPLFHLGRATVSLTAADLLIWLLAGILVARWMLARRRGDLTRPPLHMWLVAAVAGLSGAAWLSPALPREYVVSTAKELVQWAGFFVAAPLVFLNALKTEDARRRAVWALLAVTAVTVVIGLAQGALAQAGGGPDWLFGTWHRELEEREIDPAKVVGLFGSRTVYGVHMAMVLPVALALAVGLRRPGVGVALTVLAVAGAASVTVPGPFLALTLGLVAAGFLSAPSRGARWPYAAAGLAVAVAGLLVGPFRAEKLDWSIVYDREVVVAVESPEPVAPPEEAAPEYAPGEGPGGMLTESSPAAEEAAPEYAPGEGPGGMLTESSSAAEETAPEYAPGEGPGGMLTESSPAAEETAPEYAPGEGPGGMLTESSPAAEETAPEYAPGEGPGGMVTESSPQAETPPSAAPETPTEVVLVPTVDNRYAEWGGVLEMIGSRESPVAVIGVGPGHYQEWIGAYLSVLPKFGKLETDFQGQYLVLVAELGLTGLAAFALFLGASLRGALAGVRNEPTAFARALSAGLAGGFVALIAANLHACPVVRGTGVTLVLLACLISASAREPIRKD